MALHTHKKNKLSKGNCPFKRLSDDPLSLGGEEIICLPFTLTSPSVRQQQDPVTPLRKVKWEQFPHRPTHTTRRSPTVSEHGGQSQMPATESSASDKLDPSRESSQKQKDTGTETSCNVNPKHPYKNQHKPKKPNKKLKVSTLTL